MDDGLRFGARRIAGWVAAGVRARLSRPRQAAASPAAANRSHPIRAALPAMHRLARHRASPERRHRGAADAMLVGAAVGLCLDAVISDIAASEKKRIASANSYDAGLFDMNRRLKCFGARRKSIMKRI